MQNSYSKRTILFVDDDIDFLIQMKPRLEAEGFKVITSESQEEAGKMLGEIVPDLVISDLMMENFDAGFQLAYKVKKMNPKTPVIIVTNVANELGIKFNNTNPEEHEWIKADAMLTKPVRFEQLMQSITHLLP